jgi:hypothetical protein
MAHFIETFPAARESGSLTNSWTSASPIPVPSCVRPRVFSTRWKRSNNLGSSSANPSIADVELRGPILCAELNSDLTAGRKFERIRQEVENNLFPHVRVYIDRLGKFLAIHVHAEAGLLDRCSEHACKFGREIA